MGPFVLSRVAGRALARNKMRTALAALGVIISVGAVICTVAIGEGAAVQIEKAISPIGVNFVWVEAGSANVQGVRTGGYGTRTLVDEDAVAIRNSVRAAGRLGWPIHISTRAMVVALTVSTLIGIFFGLYPARKAARLDPIRALQYE
ncbi:MAG: ABC transporter permease [Bacteroidales bacterium]